LAKLLQVLRTLVYAFTAKLGSSIEHVRCVVRHHYYLMEQLLNLWTTTLLRIKSINSTEASYLRNNSWSNSWLNCMSQGSSQFLSSHSHSSFGDRRVHITTGFIFQAPCMTTLYSVISSN